MLNYLKILDKPDWDKIEELTIGEFCWDYDFKPLSKAKIFILKDRAICVRMWSYEDNPVSLHTENDSYVYKDSCLEFFFNAYPEESDIYLNFEVNHIGTIYVQFGAGRGDRKLLSGLQIAYPEVRTFKGKDEQGDFWGIEYEIPLNILQAIYGKNDIFSGQIIKAGLYKCGDNTGRPHYGSWQKIETETPDFHRPEFFGKLEIK